MRRFVRECHAIDPFVCELNPFAVRLEQVCGKLKIIEGVTG